MEWKTLQKRITAECIKAGKSQEYLRIYLLRAKKMFDHKVPLIMSVDHLAALIGIDDYYLRSMAYATDKFYRTFDIPKKNGKVRRIDEPLPDLKYVQTWILNNVLSSIQVSPYAKAFVKGRNAKENARFHRNQKVVITMDVQDFFPSIGINRVIHIFTNCGYEINIARFLAHLCCYNDALPQGAPTSPYLSNIAMKSFDSQMAIYIKENNLRYTRYADDITVSGNTVPSETISFITETLMECGFMTNRGKTRVANKNARQEVTGIVVNQKINIPRNQRKEIRQEVYYIKKYGLDSHLAHIKEVRKNYLYHLLGKIGYAVYMNQKDAEMKEYYYYIKSLINS